MPGTKMAIDTLEAIPAGDTTQWIRIRGASASNPVLLLIQQGPGLPMINEARRFERASSGWNSTSRSSTGTSAAAAAHYEIDTTEEASA